MSHSQKNNRFTAISFIFLSSLVFSGAQAQEKNQQIKPGDDRAAIQGEVVEKIDASSYSYLRLKTANGTGDTWVAVPQTKIKIHKQVTLKKPIPMFGFESKILKRKFDRIYFGVLTEQAKEVMKNTRGHWIPGVTGNGPAPSAVPGHPAHPTTGNGKSVDLGQIKVKKAEGENGFTVSELFSKKADLKSKTVLMRGKVIKYNSGILGKNWIHLADGSGSLKKGNFDVTVITQDEAKLGDTILVSGVLTLDKKLDPYFFPVAIENAKIKRN